MKNDMRVPARYYLRLDEVLRREGIDMLELAAGIGLPTRELQEPDALLPFSCVEQLVAAVQRATPRTDLGFELGRLLSPSAHSIVGFGMLSCADIGQALRFVSRYFGLVMPTFRLRCAITGEYTELHFSPILPMGRECLAFHLEAMATAALRDVRDMAGGTPTPCRIQISIPAPAHAERYAELKDVKVQFGTDGGMGTRLRFPADLGTRPLTMADHNALKVADERCRTLVDQVARVRRFGEWIAMTLREAGDGLSTLPEVARVLNLSTRSLNRYLEREGTRFRDIAGQVNHRLACERLAGAGMSVTEVAYSLGFNDTANFTRAFRTREGCSPSEYRKRHLAS